MKKKTEQRRTSKRKASAKKKKCSPGAEIQKHTIKVERTGRGNVMQEFGRKATPDAATASTETQVFIPALWRGKNATTHDVLGKLDIKRTYEQGGYTHL